MTDYFDVTCVFASYMHYPAILPIWRLTCECTCTSVTIHLTSLDCCTVCVLQCTQSALGRHVNRCVCACQMSYICTFWLGSAGNCKYCGNSLIWITKLTYGRGLIGIRAVAPRISCWRLLHDVVRWQRYPGRYGERREDRRTAEALSARRSSQVKWSHLAENSPVKRLFILIKLFVAYLLWSSM